MPNISHLFNHSRSPVIIFTLIFGVILMTGCGGRLIPRDLKDYVSHDLKFPRRNIDVDQTYRTTIIFRLEQVRNSEAYQAEKDLIESCVEYFRRDNVTDFIQDTLIFHVRSNSDADVYMKWTAPADMMRDLVKERMTPEEFFERCQKEENW